ncbi:hypothetical protein J2X31_003333 [Flavobacterium arsenatis]|uniref:Uncharacterized protein n=1 Tax=Flavobacterium arsenatis TaxID=1484332 RepID=A0ABU1TTV8_9FLAO|nr:hypothetical protein [Flavobacterium arsenatis]
MEWPLRTCVQILVPRKPLAVLEIVFALGSAVSRNRIR